MHDPYDWMKDDFLHPQQTTVVIRNDTGEPSVKGKLVCASRAVNFGAEQVTDGRPDTFGIIVDENVPVGGAMTIATGGVADVLFIGSTTRGHLARSFIASEVGYMIGRALSEAFPSSPFASDKHFCEIGHILETRSGAGLAKVMLHFN